ncbi:cupin domain-containing protein [Candidatus Pacearchaeota archaeon]|nr:cupin domain-containing protein [Candidatus Pacearchaeota archaeon]MBD3283778.1 cupin domain-containing protein [Candidatus Pacearchaeota archaeon]
MKPRIIKSKDLKENNFGHIKVTDIINTKNYPEISIAKVKLTGNEAKLGYDTKSDVLYYVVEGKGKCIINKKEHLIKKGDLVFIPKNTKYRNTKGLTLLAISSPRFNRKHRKYTE